MFSNNRAVNILAAAIWFDADARIYQRDLAGDYGLYAALPGAVVDAGARRLTMATQTQGKPK